MRECHVFISRLNDAAYTLGLNMFSDLWFEPADVVFLELVSWAYFLGNMVNGAMINSDAGAFAPSLRPTVIDSFTLLRQNILKHKDLLHPAFLRLRVGTDRTVLGKR